VRSRLLLIWILFFTLISLPFIYAAFSAGGEYIFGGFLLNPIDGNTYLAKMYQGWQGEWRFKLPYTAEQGNGAYLFLFYIFLGHLSRLSGLSLILVFHIARLVSVFLFLYVLWKFISVSGVEPNWRIPIFALAVFGSGMGWILFPFGILSSDFLVPETYPFLSSFVNPHFPLGLALLLLMLMGVSNKENETDKKIISDWPAGLVALLLSIVDPFGVVIALVVLGGLIVWSLLIDILESRKVEKPALAHIRQENSEYSLRIIGIRLGWIIGFGMPILIYDVLISNLDPVLAGWNAQNLTPSPPIWDLMLSLSPALILVVLGSKTIFKERRLYPLLLVIWVVLIAVLLYLPLGLQRRFMKGLYIPVVLLAFFPFYKLAQEKSKKLKPMLIGVFIFSTLSNLIVLIIAFYGIQTRDPLLYLTRGESMALDWIEEHTQSDALFLGSAQTGLFIPAHTGRRVLYGHPFETVNALKEEADVNAFFSGDGQNEPDLLLADREVDYVFFGPREKDLGTIPQSSQLKAVYDQNGVTIFQVITDNPN
jgi:hypothetical protein